MISNRRTVLGPNPPAATVPARRHAMCGRPEGWLGHGLVARSSRIGGPSAAHAPGTLRRGHRAQSMRGTAWWRARRLPGGD
jgi:hypothetical protein